MTGVGNQTGTKAGAGAKPGAGFEAEVRGEATAYVGTGHHVEIGRASCRERV